MTPTLPAAVRRHYRDFYDGPAALAPRAGGRAVLVVVGNCQAESLRLLLEGDDVVGVRLPPVHELTVDDVGPLHRLLARADLLVAQPVTDDYRGLPVGTAQVRARLRPGVPVALVPSVRWAGLHPAHVLVHPPGLAHADPPLVAYHDLRTAAAAAWERAGRPAPEPPGLTRAAVLAVGERSRGLLRERQERHGTVPVDDLLEGPGFAAMRTVNHPGNAVLEPVAERLRAALGLPARPPGVTRPLLDAVHAPREAAVAEVRDPSAEPTDDWTVAGRPLAGAEVHRAHLAHYREHPDVVDAVLERGAVELDLLGLRLPGAA